MTSPTREALAAADRILAALRKDPALLHQVAQHIERIPRCGPWHEHPTLPDTRHRYGVKDEQVAEVTRNFDGSASWWADDEAGQSPTVEEAVDAADKHLEERGWVLVPDWAWAGQPPRPGREWEKDSSDRWVRRGRDGQTLIASIAQAQASSGFWYWRWTILHGAERVARRTGDSTSPEWAMYEADRVLVEAGLLAGPLAAPDPRLPL